MSTVIHQEVSGRLPKLVLHTGRVKIGKVDNEGILNYLNASWQNLGSQIGPDGPKSHPLINKWRETLRSAGVPVKDCPISIEAIAKRAARGGIPFSINPIVDTYNAISMDLVLPLGAYDCSDLNGSFQLRLSPGGENFTPIGSNETESTVNNEIVFADDSDILTRHFLWRQSEKAKITQETTEYIFVCEMLEDMGEDLIELTRNRITSKFTSLLGADIINFQTIRLNRQTGNKVVAI